MAPLSKDQLIAKANELGIALTGTETNNDISTLIKGKTGEVPVTNTPNQQTGDEPAVTFTPAQMEAINKMFAQHTASTLSSTSPNAPISMYNLRDPKKIETVNVKRMLGKFVMGFKNLQIDPFKKEPRYYRIGVDPIRKLANEPYVTLILSDDGKTFEEKEVLLVDYMNERENFVAKVLDVKLKETIHDHGILGRVSGDMGLAVDSKGQPEARPTIAQQSKTVERSFVVQLPGFDTQSEFISDFLA